MRKKGYPISLAIVLASLSFTMPAMAQKVPGFSDNVSVDQMQTSFERQRSEEEWAKLRDNVISWEEIGDLVHEYNPTVSSLWRNFRESDSKGSYNVNVEDARNQVEEAYEKALSAADGNSVAEALAEMQYQTDSSNFSADTVAQNADREIAKLSVEQTEQNTIETIKKSFISHKHLATNGLLGWASKKCRSPCIASGLTKRYSGTHAHDGDQVMSTPMT